MAVVPDPLSRIADALDRLAPAPPRAADLGAHPAYVWRGGILAAARAFAPLAPDRLVGIDAQKAALIDNCLRLARGHAAQDVLLWGARGTGKSALAKAAVGAVQAQRLDLALIEAAAGELASLPDLFTLIGSAARPFVVFIDDLGFDTPGDARALRSLLEGGAEARPDNARLVVTANRRHLVPRAIDEHGEAVNPRDAIDDQLALADRFGLSLGFHALDQQGYLAIVAGYARAHGLAFDPSDAIEWAARRGSRSGRVAWQYAIELAGRAGKAL
ncbi:ATP-binding protein [Sphingomonas baiyangensis]|uniref:DUF815 domain-containing protein n=1 Tax=Sphingomonas baiyangensis TaxID=2572576 RepID=A0A4V5PTG2_9SPHN|nr:DUF815 domain-containing protein [Sphingomonas baiyangensis]TKD49898.1 DUF815 domain-containing protein [Sphingomonas baiyangensis]